MKDNHAFPIVALLVLILNSALSDLTPQNFYEGCVEGDKLCHGYSTDGSQHDLCAKTGSCLFAVTITSEAEEKLHFGLMGAQADLKWVGFGISTDRKMGADGVVLCINNDDGIQNQLGRNTRRGVAPKILPENLQSQLVKLSTKAEGGKYICEFELPSKIDFDAGMVLDLGKTNYHILLAAGELDDGDLMFHGLNKRAVADSERIYLALGRSIDASGNEMLTKQRYKSLGVTSNENGYFWEKMHGGLMITGYMVFMSFPPLLARFFRETFSYIRYKRKRLWYLVHISCAVTSAILAFAGWICIVIGKEYFFPPSYCGRIHAIIGYISLGFLLIQVTSFWIHPAFGEKKRRIFRYHLFNGISAYSLGIFNVTMATFLTVGVLPKIAFSVGVTWITVHICTFVALSSLLWYFDHWDEDTKDIGEEWRVVRRWPMILVTMEDSEGKIQRLFVLGTAWTIAMCCAFTLLGLVATYGNDGKLDDIVGFCKESMGGDDEVTNKSLSLSLTTTTQHP